MKNGSSRQNKNRRRDNLLHGTGRIRPRRWPDRGTIKHPRRKRRGILDVLLSIIHSQQAAGNITQRDLTPEIAEHAEVTMAKAQGPGGMGRNGPISNASGDAKKPPRGFQERISALSAFSSVIFYLLVVTRRGYGERKIFIPQNEKISTNRKEPGGRREDEILMK
jgi:hypothetical protein